MNDTMRTIQNPNRPFSQLTITRRPNGGILIAQGPARVLVGADETAPLIEAIAELESLPSNKNKAQD